LPDLAELLERSGTPPAGSVGGFAPALAELVQHELAFLHAGAEPRQLSALAVDPATLGLEESRWRALHAARAQALEQRGAHASEWLPHAWRAAPGPETARRVREQMRALRDRGLAQRALGLYEALRALAREAQLELPHEIAAEAAQAWIALGQPEPALEIGRALAAAPAVRSRAAAECVQGAVAIVRHDWSSARAHYDEAQRIDSGELEEVLHGRARLFFEARQDQDLDQLWSAARSAPAGTLAPRLVAYVESLQAMSLFRRGEVAAARALLEASLATAERDADAGREAGVRLNLATIARRAGQHELAIEHAGRAVESYQREGHLPGLATARALLGGLWRDGGELLRAADLSASAEELRTRLGDVSGALAARGMLGLLAAEQGHVRAAERDLERAARGLREAGRSGDAALFEARALEVRARFQPPATLPAGAPAGGGEAARASEADPRSLCAHARRAWLHGEHAAALELAQRAHELASTPAASAGAVRGAAAARVAAAQR
jgi:tetratricopeptide (TPR) repeat protein